MCTSEIIFINSMSFESGGNFERRTFVLDKFRDAFIFAPVFSSWKLWKCVLFKIKTGGAVVRRILAVEIRNESIYC